jgi:hypothetical protein
MFKMYVPLMLLQPGVHGTACLPNVDLAALTSDSLPLSLFLYSWLFLTGGSVCSYLLTLVHGSWIFLP